MARAQSGTRPLTIERIEIQGNTRTGRGLVLATAALEEGGAAAPDSILLAAERLRASGFFRAVEVATRRGSAPGEVVVVFHVRELGPELRLGTGFEDLSGWYLIPAQLNLDNLTGHGEGLSLSTRFGYRVTGIVLTLRRPLPTSARTFWEVRLRVEGQDRIYFVDRTEIRHHVGRGGVDLRAGHALGGPFAIEGCLSLEGVKADSSAEIYQDSEAAGRDRGDPLPFEDLPDDIRDDLGERKTSRLGGGLVLDDRAGAGLEARGLWGRARLEAAHSDEADFVAGEVDLRGYLPLGSGALLASRVRAAGVSAEAPFYERLYLGGLTTVRGYPSQALSPPAGEGAIATMSLELRTAWVGPPLDPLLTGLAFLDLGAGSAHGVPDLSEGAAGIGYGFRLRLPWIGRIGVDVGCPLSGSPVDEAFHVNAALQWVY
jgi:outer membrane protein assembly factor BamA